MQIKKILGFVLMSTVAVIVGLAIVNRAKRQVALVGKVIGE